MNISSENRYLNVAAVILSGGQGERMQGQDKGLVSYRGRPMIEWSLQTVAPLVGEVLISCNRNRTEYGQFSMPLVADCIEGFVGPLGGMHAAMNKVEGLYEHLLVLPCDTPHISSEVLRLLLSASAKEPGKIIFLSAGGRPQFLHAIIPVSLKQALADWLAEGQRAVYRWYKTCEVVQIDAEEYADSLLNVNRLSQIESQLP